MFRPNKHDWSVLDAIDSFLIEWERWQSEPGGPIGDELADALRAMLTVKTKGCSPGISRLLESICQMQQRIDSHGDDLTATHPAMKLVEDLIAIRTAQSPVPSVRIESMPELMKLPRMQQGQVAKMYGLIDTQGKLRVDLVQRELDNPGTVIDPSTGLVCDVVEGFDRPVTFPPSRIANPHSREFTSPAAEDPAPPKGREPVKESFEELFALDGMHDEQIARMKCVEVEFVRAEREKYERQRERAKAETELRDAQRRLEAIA